MKNEISAFSYEVYSSYAELNEEDAELMLAAKGVVGFAYAPYSAFKVGAVAMLANGELVSGTNQENASFPAGICAERVLLSAISSLYPGVPIQTIALTYSFGADQSSKHPISPCGLCRQSLLEYEHRQELPIALILGGNRGEIYKISRAALLLPLAFSKVELEKN